MYIRSPAEFHVELSDAWRMLLNLSRYLSLSLLKHRKLSRSGVEDKPKKPKNWVEPC